jgi:hypothetical protein
MRSFIWILIWGPKYVTKHSHEPKKGYPGERHKVHGKRHIPRILCEPSALLEGVRWHRKPHEPEHSDPQHRKYYTAKAAALGVFR